MLKTCPEVLRGEHALSRFEGSASLFFGKREASFVKREALQRVVIPDSLPGLEDLMNLRVFMRSATSDKTRSARYRRNSHHHGL